MKSHGISRHNKQTQAQYMRVNQYRYLQLYKYQVNQTQIRHRRRMSDRQQQGATASTGSQSLQVMLLLLLSRSRRRQIQLIHKNNKILVDQLQDCSTVYDGQKYILMALSGMVFLATDEPHDLEEALANDHWKRAMDEEYLALIKNQTWHLVPPEHGRNVIDCKWVYKVKQKADGSIDRYKARLVAKGFKQRYGID